MTKGSINSAHGLSLITHCDAYHTCLSCTMSLLSRFISSACDSFVPRSWGLTAKIGCARYRGEKWTYVTCTRDCHVSYDFGGRKPARAHCKQQQHHPLPQAYPDTSHTCVRVRANICTNQPFHRLSAHSTPLPPLYPTLGLPLSSSRR